MVLQLSIVMERYLLGLLAVRGNLPYPMVLSATLPWRPSHSTVDYLDLQTCSSINHRYHGIHFFFPKLNACSRECLLEKNFIDFASIITECIH